MLLCIIGTRAFVHVETHTKTLDVRAVKERLVGYSGKSNSYRTCDPATRRIIKNRNAMFIDTPSRLFTPPTEESLVQVSGNGVLRRQ